MKRLCIGQTWFGRLFGSLLHLALAAGVWGVVPRAGGDDAGTRVEVSRDLWISAYPGEHEGNNGASARLKLKSIQEFFLIDFDPAPLRGQVCVQAQLHVRNAGSETLGRVTVSTVAAPWFEGDGEGYAVTAAGSSFQWQRGTSTPWPGDSGDITGVVLGNGGSRWGFGDPTARDAGQWQSIPIDPAVVQLRLDGHSHGFFVFDDVGSEYTRRGNTIDYHAMPNRFVYSRESSASSAPYFTLWLRPRGAAERSAEPPVAHRLQAVPPGVLPPLPPRAADEAAGDQVAGTDQQNVPADAGPLLLRDLDGQPIRDGRLYAARGESVGVFIPAQPEEISIEPSPGIDVTVFRTPLVRGLVDPLVPLAWTGQYPAAEPAVQGDTYVELYVGKTAAPGRRQLMVRAAGRVLTVPLTVWNFALPDRLSFIPQMNAYSLPGHEFDYFRLAHEHRTTLNHLRYGWSGKVDADAVPRRDAGGQWDWSQWDARFGPLFDGSAFAGARRAGVPVEAFYLPLNENWPMDHERHFRGGYWIEHAYDADYWREFRAAATEFARHLAQQRWNDTMFEFYLNNKIYFKHDRDRRWDACSAAWIFDEPMHTQDFWALRRFGQEFWSAVQDVPGPQLVFRVDISRPQWQRDLLDDVANVEVVSGALRTYRDRVIARAERLGHLVYMYGAAGAPAEMRSMSAAWCVETWALGADGVVPWQTIGTEASWREPDALSLFYPTTTGPVPSIRLKAFCHGQQLVEYLTIYGQLTGQHRRAVGAAVLSHLGWREPTPERGSAESAPYARNCVIALRDLRLALGNWLDAQAPDDRSSWRSPRPLGQRAAAELPGSRGVISVGGTP
jgi:hypothetical protein